VNLVGRVQPGRNKELAFPRVEEDWQANLVPTMTKSYELDDYVWAMVAAVSYRKAVPQLKDWHERRRAALESTLIPSAKAPEESGAFALNSMLERTIELAAKVQTPFSGIMEFPSEAYKVVEPHAKPLEDLADRTRAELRALARSILVQLHPGLEHRRVTSEDLKRNGFDDSNEPDPDDYW